MGDVKIDREESFLTLYFFTLLALTYHIEMVIEWCNSPNSNNKNKKNELKFVM